MWHRWFPWKFVIRHFARSQGFLDPITVLTWARRFSQPAEVAEPIELLRAGAVFHARGLINSRAIQHNLDWIWPYWVRRQFDPLDESFVPRAFSITHINLTHRNWTAVGLPGLNAFPLVDPAGLLTPVFDGWSLDGWIVRESGEIVAPSKTKTLRQFLNMEDGLKVVTEFEDDGSWCQTEAEVVQVNGVPECTMRLRGRSDSRAWLAVSLRPYNPEGVSFVHSIEADDENLRWTLDSGAEVVFNAAPDRHGMSDYVLGDVALQLPGLNGERRINCDVGMATAAALFEIPSNGTREVTVNVPLENEGSHARSFPGWRNTLDGACALTMAHDRFQFLYDAALRTVMLHAPDDVYAGPYTYKRFWFRDTTFILKAMLCAGMADRAEAIIDRFDERQSAFGYFHSQEGEWDSNGQVLWIVNEFCRLTGRPPKSNWMSPIRSGAHWISKKRKSVFGARSHPGLFPAGFSAEHLGPVDFYYWDNFWGVAGLRAASHLFAQQGDIQEAERCVEDAEAFMADIDASLSGVEERLGRPAMPAAPLRRLDSGAVGSLACSYPCEVVDPRDPRLFGTVEHLIERCVVNGGFFQDMIHSGINPYLTLHLAQVLLRAGDPRYQSFVETVARMASPTGQWPEAVHPRTGGGCMGDGQHVWAASEWLVMMRNCFVMEDFPSGRLILCAGVSRDWLDGETPVRFGPAPTYWGVLELVVTREAKGIVVSWNADWRGDPPEIEIRFPGAPVRHPGPHDTAVTVEQEAYA